MGLLISDGYTFDAVIPARGPWPAVSVRYRPALAEEVYEYARVRKDTGKQVLAAAVSLLSKHLVGWDVTDDKGELAPITAETLRRVPQPYIDRMLDLVTGYTPAEQEIDVKN